MFQGRGRRSLAGGSGEKFLCGSVWYQYATLLQSSERLLSCPCSIVTRMDLEKALSLIPGKHRLNLHAIYAETGDKHICRNKLESKHFSAWVDWAKDNGLKLDFNGTFFSHTKAQSGFTLASSEVSDGRTVEITDTGGNAGTNNITISTEGSETISGDATLVMNIDYTSVTLRSDGTNWFIV